MSVTHASGKAIIGAAATLRLADIAALAVTDGNIIVGNGSTWVAESGATARTSLGLGTGNTPQFTGIVLDRAGSTNRWVVSSGNSTMNSSYQMAISGSKELSGAITTIRAYAGANFDAGTMYVGYIE